MTRLKKESIFRFHALEKLKVHWPLNLRGQVASLIKKRFTQVKNHYAQHFHQHHNYRQLASERKWWRLERALQSLPAQDIKDPRLESCLEMICERRGPRQMMVLAALAGADALEPKAFGFGSGGLLEQFIRLQQWPKVVELTAAYAQHPELREHLKQVNSKVALLPLAIEQMMTRRGGSTFEEDFGSDSLDKKIHWMTEWLKSLKAAGVPWESCSELGLSALHRVVGDLDPAGMLGTLSQGYPWCRWLAESGFNLEVPHQKGGRTPLMSAARAINPEAMKILLEQGANPNAVDEQGDSAAHYLALSCFWGGSEGAVHVEEAFALLIAFGANLQQKNHQDQCPKAFISDRLKGNSLGVGSYESHKENVLAQVEKATVAAERFEIHQAVLKSSKALGAEKSKDQRGGVCELMMDRTTEMGMGSSRKGLLYPANFQDLENLEVSGHYSDHHVHEEESPQANHRSGAIKLRL